MEEQPQPSVGFLQSATDFSILGGSIASIGGDSFTAQRDVHVTINHHHPSSPNASSTSSNLSTEDQDPEPSNISSMQTQIGTFSDNVMFPRPLPVDIYRRHLEAKGRGISLWVPGPDENLPIQYQRVGIAIGDVGIVTPSGSFIFLFNVCDPSTMPPDLKPLASDVIQKLKIAKHRKFSEHSYLSSVSSVRRRDGDSTGLVFESSEQDGAILTMPAGAKSEDLTNVVFFRKYVAANLLSWYRYAYHDQGYEVRNGDLRVATGTDKASTWGMATFSKSRRQESATVLPGGEQKFHFEFGLVDNGDGSLDRKQKRYKWACLGGAEVQVGPGAKEIAKLRGGDGDDDEDVVYENQCLFIRTLNATLPDALWEQVGIDEEEEVDYGHHSHHSMNGSAMGGSSSSSRQGGNSDNGSPLNQGGNLSSSGSRNQAAFSSSIRIGNIGPYCHPTPDYSSISLVDHPSNTINQFLVKNCSEDTAIAVTTDQDWISVLREDDPVIPSSEELLGRIVEAYDIREEDGVVFLDTKCQNPSPQFLSPYVIEIWGAESADSSPGGLLGLPSRLLLQGEGGGGLPMPLLGQQQQCARHPGLLAPDHYRYTQSSMDGGLGIGLGSMGELNMGSPYSNHLQIQAQQQQQQNSSSQFLHLNSPLLSMRRSLSPNLGGGGGGGGNSDGLGSDLPALRRFRRASSGSSSDRGAEVWRSQSYGHHSSASLGGGSGSSSGVRSASPYLSPIASPRVRYEELQEQEDDVVGGVGGLGLGLGLGYNQPQRGQQQRYNDLSDGGGLSIGRGGQQNVTTRRTSSASIRRRRQDATFACTVPGCNSTFTRWFNLKGHLRSHYEQKPYKCHWPGCEKGFAREHDCKRHEQLHSNFRSFECEGCKKQFARMDALNRHLRSEAGAECARVVKGARDAGGVGGFNVNVNVATPGMGGMMGMSMGGGGMMYDGNGGMGMGMSMDVEEEIKPPPVVVTRSGRQVQRRRNTDGGGDGDGGGGGAVMPDQEWAAV